MNHWQIDYDKKGGTYIMGDKFAIAEKFHDGHGHLCRSELHAWDSGRFSLMTLIDDTNNPIASFGINGHSDGWYLHGVMTEKDHRRKGHMTRLFKFMEIHYYDMFGDQDKVSIRLNTDNNYEGNVACRIYVRRGWLPVRPGCNTFELNLVSYQVAMDTIEQFMTETGIRDLCTNMCHGSCCTTGEYGNEDCYEMENSCKILGRKISCSAFLCRSIQDNIIMASMSRGHLCAHGYLRYLLNRTDFCGNAFFDNCTPIYKKMMFNPNSLWPFFDEHISRSDIKKRMDKAMKKPPPWMHRKRNFVSGK